MAKKKSVYICQECGYESAKWMGKCSTCNNWNTFVEEVVETKKISNNQRAIGNIEISKLDELNVDNEERIKTSIAELDRVLGGGIVKGSLVLYGGDPGIGKSTLLIQISGIISNLEKKVLYVSGEESVNQIKLRANRLDIEGKDLFILAETSLYNIEGVIEKIKPDIVVIDSIQTMYSEDIDSAPGSVSQVREVTSKLMKISKSKDISTMIVGHVTKEGTIAGPRMLEHMVDTVLYFEGERHNTYRILRSVKNRFGSTNEIGIFEMRDKGLIEVGNPSKVLIENRPTNTEGSIIVPSLEGSRPMLVEIQSLVAKTPFGMPRRVVTGLDYNRVILMTAVLEKKGNIRLENSDIYINTVGGISIKEPAMDLGVVLAIVSSFRDESIKANLAAIGEVGLTGEIRGVSGIEKRIAECEKMGFETVLIPSVNGKNLEKNNNIKIINVTNIGEAINIALRGDTI